MAKVCIIGLDGTPFTLLKTLAEEKIMPNTGKILADGTGLPMTTAFPEISSVAWTSFMTGKNPGKHGIFGFADLKPESYQIYFPNYLDIKCETLWDILGKHGKRSIVVNLPSTYPAQELNGIMISGFVAPNFDRAIYPPELSSELKKAGYRIDVDLEKALESKDFLINDINDAHEKRERVILDLLTNKDWDLFIGVITETDRLHHFLWDEFQNASSCRKDFTDYYRKVDDFIGKVKDNLDKDTLFIVISDHGFCTVNKQVYLNHWLEQTGYLRYKTPEPQFVMDIDPGQTKAFCMDPGRIYINTRNRFSGGIVEEDDYENIRQELIKALLSLKSPDSSPIIKHVRKKEELYDGPQIEKAPDLVVEAERGFDLKGSVAKKVVFENGPWTGMHTSDDATFYMNRKIDSQPIEIFDIAPIILSHFDIEIPADMDGKVLL